MVSTTMLQIIVVATIGTNSALITSTYKSTLTPAGRNSIPILEIRISQIPSIDDAGITLPHSRAVRISMPSRDGGKGTPRALMISVDIHCKSSKNAMPRNRDVGDIKHFLLKKRPMLRQGCSLLSGQTNKHMNIRSLKTDVGIILPQS